MTTNVDERIMFSAQELNKCSQGSFLERGQDKMCVDLLHIEKNDSNTLSRLKCETYNQLRAKLGPTEQRRNCASIVTLSAWGSFDPVRIFKEDLQQLILDEMIQPVFSAIISSFGVLPWPAQQGSNCLLTEQKPDGSFTGSYLLKFAEQDQQKNWKIRQIGVYQIHRGDLNSTLTILVLPHPLEEDTFGQRLLWSLQNPEYRARILSQPLAIHQTLFQTYLNDWRWYSMQQGDQLANISRHINIASINPDRLAFELKLETLQDCERLLERIIPLSNVMDASIEIVETINKLDTQDPSFGSPCICKNVLASLRDVKKASEVLQKQANGMIDLLGNTLSLKNQQDAAQLNEHLLRLTTQSTKDSATVLVITIVTMVYLPATFAATLFGMNFFSFDNQNRRIILGTNMWIYFALFVPLTAVTMFLSYWFWHKKTEELDTTPNSNGSDEEKVGRLGRHILTSLNLR